ncbi:MAG TPA: SIMPL domain-containing protein [Candidatus Saccharimonadia bacterium]|nr:SIMPL domain-containing protein [Candidatus Saccharimonadia bacterium]
MIRSIPLLAFAMLSPLSTNAAEVTSPARGTLLQVSAQGEVRRVPDVAQVGVGVVTEASDAKAALAANAAQMERVIAAVRKAGIADKDVQTTGVSLQPQYQYVENQPPKLNGYQAHNRVSVKVRDVSKVGEVLDAFVSQGANQIDGPSFTLDKPEAALDEARQVALENARTRAAMYAKSLGLKVARIVSIDETGGGFEPPRPMMMAKAEMAQDSAQTPIMPGEQAHGITLNVVFELD